MWCTFHASWIIAVSILVFLACPQVSSAPSKKRPTNEKEAKEEEKLDVVKQYIQGEPENTGDYNEWYPAEEIENELQGIDYSPHSPDLKVFKRKTGQQSLKVICADGSGKDCKNKSGGGSTKKPKLNDRQAIAMLSTMEKMMGDKNANSAQILEIEDRHIEEKNIVRDPNKGSELTQQSQIPLPGKDTREFRKLTHPTSAVDSQAEVNFNGGINAHIDELIAKYPNGKWPADIHEIEKTTKDSENVGRAKVPTAGQYPDGDDYIDESPERNADEASGNEYYSDDDGGADVRLINDNKDQIRSDSFSPAYLEKMILQERSLGSRRKPGSHHVQEHKLRDRAIKH